MEREKPSDRAHCVFPIDAVVCFLCSNVAADAKQRLSGVEKLTLRDDDVVDITDEVSSAAKHSTLTLLLRYQRLLVSRFIANDKLESVAGVLSLSGTYHKHSLFLTSCSYFFVLLLPYHHSSCILLEHHVPI